MYLSSVYVDSVLREKRAGIERGVAMARLLRQPDSTSTEPTPRSRRRAMARHAEAFRIGRAT